jgi:zinc resistance-associated protein
MNSFRLRTMRFALVLTALIALSGQAWAAEGPGPGAPSPEKQAIAKKFCEDFYKNTEGVRRELIAKRHELGAQMYAQNPDEGKIQALAAEISGLRAKLYAARVALKTKLIQAGIPAGCGGPGMGYGYGHGMRGGPGMDYGPDHGHGMGRGYGPGPGMRGGPGMERGFGSCCQGDAGGGQ